jgi:hypothetical protein
MLVLLARASIYSSSIGRTDWLTSGAIRTGSDSERWIRLALVLDPTGPRAGTDSPEVVNPTRPPRWI